MSPKSPLYHATPQLVVNGTKTVFNVSIDDVGGGRLLSVDDASGKRLLTVPLVVMRTQLEAWKARKTQMQGPGGPISVHDSLAALLGSQARMQQQDIPPDSCLELAQCVHEAVPFLNADLGRMQ